MNHLRVMTFYPINFLRNLALNGTSTRFVFVNDIDFIPCRESYKRLLKYTKKLKKNQLLVIPAFEELSNGTRLADQFPENKNALMKLWNEEAVVPFHFTDFMPGHNATNYKKWSRAKNPYQIKWTKWYEPYVVGYTAELPKYNQQYVGRYENKAEHVAEMYARGFELLVLPDVCIVHVWHPRAARDSNMYR
ncbi:hypothetical protein LSH36_413g02052 [Paralvinella palmiformis]|uniref:Glycosyltransferase n=1 Tax=Paralvinella palmiformis TaxID=53620 RepID=A0AAD9MYM2_9ANNE|nr:hypothetical protein LSH36_413g02052 [Paralvinella palmiformis]